jgi:hypothetical protein
MLVRFDQVASVIVYANHRIMCDKPIHPSPNTQVINVSTLRPRGAVWALAGSLEKEQVLVLHWASRLGLMSR